MRNKVSILIFIIMVLITVIVLSKNPKITNSNSILAKFFKNDTNKEKEVVIKNNSDSEEVNDKKAYMESQLKCKINDLDEDIKTLGFKIKVEGVEITKKVSDKFTWNYLRGGCKFDQKGNILDKYSYVVLKLKITNEDKIEEEFSLNNINLITFDNKDKLIDRVEVHSSDSKKSIGDRQHNVIPCKDSETIENVVVYLVPDESVKYNNMVLFISFSGEESDQNTKAVMISQNRKKE